MFSLYSCGLAIFFDNLSRKYRDMLSDVEGKLHFTCVIFAIFASLTFTDSLHFTYMFALYLFLFQHFDSKWFEFCAKNYVLYGKSFEDMCQHNSDIAAQHNQIQVSLSEYCSKIQQNTAMYSNVQQCI